MSYSTIEKAMIEAKRINSLNNNLVASVKKNFYGNFNVEILNTDVEVIKNSLNMISQTKKGFLKNFGDKYGKSRNY
ncbi:hypothetical protein [Aliarcobacter butzleri]|uniref:hypothetical protein n=1 Tax=Aliarcobacter butzleri TaxID=28197 RepID=UPI001918F4E7|nr:hypothetical protein [Aliarcobacter butzleri]